jgi:hypothetical protein
MNGVTYKALSHALHAIGFKPTTGKPYKDEIDFVWRQARKDLEKDGVCTVSRNGKNYTIALCDDK